MSKGHTLQDPFLNAIRKERIPVSIFLVSGIKLQGQIESFDQFVILLKSAVSQMVYKHAISTVVPARNVKVPGSSQVDSVQSEDEISQVSKESPFWGLAGCHCLFFERPESTDVSVLVHVNLRNDGRESCEHEFDELARSAGAVKVADVRSGNSTISPSFLVGKGKLEEIHEAVKNHHADLVLFSRELTPAQERNLEKFLGCRVLDRTGLILDIFAQRARSHEGKLQVELAQLQHLISRLKRGWSHLDRQKGGIGLRGAGEKQLYSGTFSSLAKKTSRMILK